MIKIFYIFLLIFATVAVALGGDDEYDTLSIKPIGVDYSKYQGINKLYLVGECEGMQGNQIVIFQNRPSFDYFENDQEYIDEQKELEKALWQKILNHDDDPIILKGRWHRFNDRMVFLCHQIVQLNKAPTANP